PDADVGVADAPMRSDPGRPQMIRVSGDVPPTDRQDRVVAGHARVTGPVGDATAEPATDPGDQGGPPDHWGDREGPVDRGEATRHEHRPTRSSSTIRMPVASFPGVPPRRTVNPAP